MHEKLEKYLEEISHYIAAQKEKEEILTEIKSHILEKAEHGIRIRNCVYEMKKSDRDLSESSDKKPSRPGNLKGKKRSFFPRKGFASFPTEMTGRKCVVSIYISMFALLSWTMLTSAATAHHPESARITGPRPHVYSVIIESFRASIPKLMQEQGVPGVAVAVVTGQEVLWLEGFGYTDTGSGIPVTPKTLFSIQSMSKNFTAATVLMAVQEDLLDLDVPITAYLPDFSMKSRFEERPQEKMTLRLLLSHRAGFTHEAPVGNNYEPGGFKEHIHSISRTWLRFPVGQRTSYSNLGIDLAGWILQVRSKQPFHEYVKRKLLDPLGMTASTFDMERIKADSKRAIGRNRLPAKPPVEIPMVPAGGLYTNASELSRWVQWHLNDGKVKGKVILEHMYRLI